MDFRAASTSPLPAGPSAKRILSKARALPTMRARAEYLNLLEMKALPRVRPVRKLAHAEWLGKKGSGRLSIAASFALPRILSANWGWVLAAR